ncbi:MAG: tRNA-dihydrouridine synthase B [Gammaproteobacteria bacterium]|jgi:tRNA-dihydrouridine synthase B
MSLRVGSIELANRLILAPMAGVTDRPFRQLCRQFGVGLTISEMISSRPDLRESRKTQLRMNHEGEPGPIAVQIAGGIPAMMADAARYNADRGAEIIDINMGCPAKKVCKVDAGSALMRDVPLVKEILETVVDAVDIPVTLKMRTGWSHLNRNAIEIAHIAEQSGIKMITIHGRTREDKYLGQAEYETIRDIKTHINIPVIANGDITDGKKAKMVLDFTGADAIMIGREAQKRPWIFQQINHYLETGKVQEEPRIQLKQQWLLDHLVDLYDFYGETQGVKIARKHINWQLGEFDQYQFVRQIIMQSDTAQSQIKAVTQSFEAIQSGELARVS